MNEKDNSKKKNQTSNSTAAPKRKYYRKKAAPKAAADTALFPAVQENDKPVRSRQPREVGVLPSE